MRVRARFRETVSSCLAARLSRSTSEQEGGKAGRATGEGPERISRSGRPNKKCFPWEEREADRLSPRLVARPLQKSSRLPAFLLFPARSPRCDERSASSGPPCDLEGLRNGLSARQ